MKKFVVLFILVVLVAVLAAQAVAAGGSPQSWAQVSHTQNVFPNAQALPFDSVDGAEGVEVGADYIKVFNGGLYLVMHAPQVTSLRPHGCYEAWIRINGEDVENSNTEYCGGARDTTVLVSQGIVLLQPGDVIEFVGKSKGAYADAIQSDAGGPLIPAHISSVVPVGY